MTSDRSVSGDAEMQLSNTPVTPPKSAGLNPNANVFQSKGSNTTQCPGDCITPTEVPTGKTSNSEGTASEWQENNTEPVATEGFTYMNGDTSSATPGVTPASGVAFPPTPESPNTMAQSTSTPDYTSMNGAPIPNEVLFSGSEAGDDITGLLEGNIPAEQLRAMLKNQLEYYFSRENLANDSYLVSQMDADQYVPISTVAGFNQVKRMTTNIDLVIEVLRESANVQVDETGEKVRPLHKRCVVILREVPDTTPIQDVEKLFSGENCPKFVSCEFAHNNSWYITFDSDEDAQQAYQYLREEVCTFLGKPIMARIKAKPLLRSTFIPKNGFKPGMSPAGPTQASPAGVVSQPATTHTQTFSHTESQYATTQRQYTFTPAVPNVPQTTQFIVGQPQQQAQTGGPAAAAQQQAAPAVTNYPFFPPNNAAAVASAVMHTTWPGAAAGSPHMPYFDPGTVSRCLDAADQLIHAFAANGYTHTGTFKMNNTQSRHGFQSMRNRNQNKPHTSRQSSGPERQNSQEGTPSSRSHDQRNTSHDRHQPISSVSRSSSRGSDIGHPSRRAERGSGSNSVETSHGSLPTATSAAVVTTTATTHSSSITATVGSTSGTSTGSNCHPVVSSGSVTSSSSTRHQAVTGGDSSAKEQGSSSSAQQAQQLPRYNQRSNYRSRRRRDDDGAKASSRGSTQASAKDQKTSLDSPKFDLETTSFPPLPGSTNSTTTGDIFENKMSDVVKGTAKPSTRENTKASSPTSVTSSQSSSIQSKETAPNALSCASPTSQSQSQPKSQQLSQSSTMTTVVKATSAGATMATSISPTSCSVTSTTSVVTSPASKGSIVSSAQAVPSLPTPPPTPPSSQPCKSETTSSVPSKKLPEKESPTSAVTATTVLAQEENVPAGMPKLTYAQMLQRKAAVEAAAASAAAGNGETSGKESNGNSNSNPPNTGTSAPITNGLPPSTGTAISTTQSTSSSNGTKPAALREQPQPSRSSTGPSTRSSDTSFRKDDPIAKDQRVVGGNGGGFRGDSSRRPAKENRGGIGERRDYRGNERGYRDNHRDTGYRGYHSDSRRRQDSRDYDSLRSTSSK